MKSGVPPGASGDWVVEHFEVRAPAPGAEDARPAWAVSPPGRYTRLRRGHETFMTDLVDELWTQRPALEEAQRRGGPVLLTGLGLGLVVDALLASTPVEQVTVVEASADVVALVAPYLRDRHGAAVEVVHADAFAWDPPRGARFTVGWHDIWPNHADPACEPESRQLFARYASHCDWQGSWALQYRTDEAAALQAR